MFKNCRLLNKELNIFFDECYENFNEIVIL